MTNLFVFTELEATPWAKALNNLRDAINQKDRDAVLNAYAHLFRSLSQTGAPDLKTAALQALLWQNSSLSRAATELKVVPGGLMAAALQDIEAIMTQLERDWTAEAKKLTGRSLPALKALAPACDNPQVTALVDALGQVEEKWLLEKLIEAYKTQGTGVFAQFKAFYWQDGAVHGIARPNSAPLHALVGIDRQLDQLRRNTLGFLNHKPAHHTLLYGPRGSGKSTAVRSLLNPFATVGLRLIEVAAKDLADLPALVSLLGVQPHRFIVFVDDLSFETGDLGYQPLKTLLEGSVQQKPRNVLVYATSNRRHLVTEQFSDRPDPLNDDVHKWDTQNERLALSDRFGLTITFPSASQRKYLEIVAALMERSSYKAEDWREQAIRFAEWGNGYSGRTAQQFIDHMQLESA